MSKVRTSGQGRSGGDGATHLQEVAAAIVRRRGSHLVPVEVDRASGEGDRICRAGPPSSDNRLRGDSVLTVHGREEQVRGVHHANVKVRLFAVTAHHERAAGRQIVEQLGVDGVRALHEDRAPGPAFHIELCGDRGVVHTDRRRGAVRVVAVHRAVSVVIDAVVADFSCGRCVLDAYATHVGVVVRGTGASHKTEGGEIFAFFSHLEDPVPAIGSGVDTEAVVGRNIAVGAGAVEETVQGVAFAVLSGLQAPVPAARRRNNAVAEAISRVPIRAQAVDQAVFGPCLALLAAVQYTIAAERLRCNAQAHAVGVEAISTGAAHETVSTADFALFSDVQLSVAAEGLGVYGVIVSAINSIIVSAINGIVVSAIDEVIVTTTCVVVAIHH